MNSGATSPAWASGALAVLTTRADILYASAAHTMARLGIGTAGEVLAVNSGATAPVWQYPALTTVLKTLTADVSVPATTMTSVLVSASLPLGTYLCMFGIEAIVTAATAAYFAAQVVADSGAGTFNGQGTSGSSGYNLQQQGEFQAIASSAESLSATGVLVVSTAGTFQLECEAGTACTVQFGANSISGDGVTFLSFVRIA